MNRLRRILLVLFTILLCVGFDQYTKALAKSHLPKTKAISFAKDTFRLDYLENKGAVLSFEYYLPDHWRGPTVTTAMTVFLAMLIPYLMFGSSFRTASAVWLSLFAGGALSNMLDRVALGGTVVDFLNLGWGSYRTCIFNVADAAIVSGVALFMASVSWRLTSLVTRGSRRPAAGYQ
jgi:signal peptidase II